MRLAQVFPLSAVSLCFVVASAAADSPLTALLAAAPSYVSRLHNIAENDADVAGHIRFDLRATNLVHLPSSEISGGLLLQDTAAAAQTLPISTIRDLTTSAKGAVQLGTIAAQFASTTPMAVPGSLGMQGANTSLAAADPNLLVSASNMGLHSGAVTGTIMVSGQNQVVQVTDQSTDVTGAISQGRIRIVIGED